MPPVLTVTVAEELLFTHVCGAPSARLSFPPVNAKVAPLFTVTPPAPIVRIEPFPEDESIVTLPSSTVMLLAVSLSLLSETVKVPVAFVPAEKNTSGFVIEVVPPAAVK